MDCFIMAGEYVYAEPAGSWCQKFRNFGPLRSHLLAPDDTASNIGPAVVETAASVPPPLWG